MANDLPPVPISAPMTDGSGRAASVWSEWFRKLSGFSDKSANGYQRLPGGVTLQWGVTASLNSGTSTAITFPLAFSTSCLAVFLTPKNNSAVATTATGQGGTGNYSVTGFDLYNRASVALTFNWFAIGH
jgi:hypothetical protein